MAGRPLLIDRQPLINHPRWMESKLVDINQPTFLFTGREKERERLFFLFVRGKEISPRWRDKKGSSIETVISSIVYGFSYPSNDVYVIQYRRERRRGTNIDRGRFIRRRRRIEGSLQSLSKPRWIRISGGRGVSIQEKRKRDTVDITVATTICPFSLRKLSIYEDPLVWADSREKKGSPTAGVSRVR